MDNHTHFHRITNSTHSFLTNLFFLFGLLLALSSNSYAAQNLIYDANGGTGTPPPTVSYNNGNIVTVSDSNGITKTGYQFSGWNTASDASGITYEAGETFTFGTTEITLYAKWDLNTTTTPPTPVTCSNGATPIYINETNPTIIGEGPLDDRCYAFQYTNHSIGGSVKIYYWSTSAIDITETIDTNSSTFALAANTDTNKGPYTMEAGDSLVLEVESINNNQEYDIIIDFTPNIKTVDDTYIVSLDENLTANVFANDTYLNDINISDNNFSANFTVNTDTGSFTYHPTTVGTYTYYYTATNGIDEENATVSIQVLPSGQWPSTCYNYYYRYNGEVYPPENAEPYISGTFNQPDQNISVTLYIRNDDNVTNITIPSMSLSIASPSSDLDYTGPSTVYKNTPTEPYEYFYAQFELEPQTTNQISAFLDLNLTISGVTRHLGTDIPQCAGSPDSTYNVQWGYFNVSSALPEYADKYNIPTQVTQRFGNFNVSAYLPNSTTGIYDVPVSLKTKIGVEIIDTSGIDINIACQDDTGGRSITDRVWMRFADDEDNTSSIFVNKAAFADALGDINLNATLTSSPEDFYKIASKDAAYRITYLATPEGELLDYTESNNKYIINNFSEIVQDVGTCVDRVLSPVGNSGNSQWTIQVAVACGNAGNQGISESHFNACLECLHGKSYVCSRDNFAIRPEAFMMHLKDQNETDPVTPTVTPIELTTLSNSGSIGASAPSPALQLAAGYAYNLEVNATNYLNNGSSPGYDTNQTLAIYDWNASAPYGFCDDTSDHSDALSFESGSTDTNTSLDQVGEYTLQILDTTWTSVDSDPSYQSHHIATYFNTDDPDCIANSSIVQVEEDYSNNDTDTKNGCNVSSQHTNPANSIKYNNYNLRTHPYKFAINNVLSVGPDDLNSTAKPFVYMANIENNESIAVHLNTTIYAQGKNNVTLTNYTGEVNATTGQTCYAQDTLFGIGKSTTTSSLVAFRYRTHDLNASGAVITDLNDTNNSVIPAGDLTTSPSMTIPADYWRKIQNGVLSLRTNMNFDRNISLAVNPEDINYTRLDMNDTANTFNADLVNNKYADGNRTVGEKINHYYGKTLAPKVTIVCNTTPCTTGTDATSDSNTNVFIYFSVYCNPKTATMCTPGLNLPGSASQTNDIRWWTNTDHNQTDGSIGNVFESVGYTTLQNGPLDPVSSFFKEAVLRYDGSASLPYDAIMDMNSSAWLIYNESNSSATTNQFEVDFIGTSDWSGKHETDSTTKTIVSPPTNRRIMW